MESNAVELALSSEIDVNPLLAEARALPRTYEAVGAANLNSLLSPEESHFGKPPLHAKRILVGACHFTCNLVPAALTCGSDGNRRHEQLAGLRVSRRVAV